MLRITERLILTAGPSITSKEVEYVNDAVQHGWNSKHSDYIFKFEEAFAKYVGVKYAMATSSCTGALHLALLSMGIGPGDEVIVPDTTWIATASAVCYVGATPVFADIEPDTWVLDPQRLEPLITSKTKLIIPVHLYGQAVDMEPLWALAEKYNLDILEDAAPSIGTEYKGRKTGSLGRAAVFSFQGAKALVTGEGGILVSNDKSLMNRARFLGDHGRDPSRVLYNSEIGYKYKMSNITAALGLAQTERAEEIVERKIQIFRWYKERLGDVPGISLNVERPGTRNIYWMSSIVLDDAVPISRDDFIKKLKERNIDSRPFFYPVSSFPMFNGSPAHNPVAYKIPLRGINLPSGHERTEEEVDYICAHIMDILDTKPSRQATPNRGTTQPHGWLSRRDFITGKLKEYKNARRAHLADYSIQMHDSQKEAGQLVPVTAEMIDDEALIQKLADWREIAQAWYPSQFRVTPEGTRRWLDKQVIHTDDRILFIVENERQTPIGHVGLFRFHYIEKYCELDNIVRGEYDLLPGAMTFACRSLLDWTFATLDMETVYLRVVSDNEKAIKLYERLGFAEIQRTPLMKVEEENTVRWIDVIGQPYFVVERYFVTMKLTRADWYGKQPADHETYTSGIMMISNGNA